MCGLLCVCLYYIVINVSSAFFVCPYVVLVCVVCLTLFVVCLMFVLGVYCVFVLCVSYVVTVLLLCGY